MLNLKIALTNFGVRDFIISPEGRIWPTFINLPIELRRRINSTASDKQVIIQALQRGWVIVKLKRVTVKVEGISQLFKSEVWADRRTFGGRIRAYHRTVELLRYLENYAKHKLPVRVRIFSTVGDTTVEIDTHLSSSADFAKIFIHTIGNYNRPIERINPVPG